MKLNVVITSYSIHYTKLYDEVIEFRSRVIREEYREPVLLLDSGRESSDDYLLICGWCKKVNIDEID